VDGKIEWIESGLYWEFATIGDPAYDLAIVTRGDRKLMGINNGLNILLDNYRKAGGAELSAVDVHIHELLLFLNWLWDSAETEKNGQHRGHGPDHYAQRTESLLRRAEKSN
jgi:aminoglycoside phosphotransferase (APT) family kinase protein